MRASEINDSWNSGTKEKDLVESLRLAQEVISHHSLAPNYSDLWNYTEPNGVNELLDEILLSAQFSSENHQKEQVEISVIYIIYLYIKICLKCSVI